MRKIVFVFSLFFMTMMLLSCKTKEENEFWGDGETFFDVQQIFDNERLPNVVTATDGTVIAVWFGVGILCVSDVVKMVEKPGVRKYPLGWG